VDDHFLSFDTICSATEDRQRAVKDLIADGVDTMIVIGGFNSSNTGHLLEISLPNGPAYHIESADCLIDRETIRAKPLGAEPETMRGWLPDGPQVIGITGGASTPDSVVGQVIARILELGGAAPPSAGELRAALADEAK
jgi:4-hydroxy-3-methylbut-2-enyl diphosphate reductase